MAGSPGGRDERTAAGVAARQAVPPSVHATWTPGADRPDPIALLLDQATTRIADLVPVRHARMAVSPFTFYRGAALPMAADLSAMDMSGLRVQACGDAHLVNFGLFASPERDLVFDINDFDETTPGAWEWDLLRLGASLTVAARSRSFDRHQAAHAVVETARSYATRMHEYAALRAIDVFYATVDEAGILEFADKRARPYLKTTIHAAARHDALHEVPHITASVDGARRIVDRPPTITHPPELDGPTGTETLAQYRATLLPDRQVLLDRYRLMDAALKVVGVGSVGLGAFAVLLEGEGDDDPLFLQVKEAEASVFERFGAPDAFAHHGERVVAGQRLLQAASDVLLGWTTGPGGRHFYVRQLQDQKAGAVVEAMTPHDLIEWGRLCGWALARAHARSGDPAAIAGYLGTDDAMADAVSSFAGRYADQVEKDHAAFVAAIRSGRVTAAT